MSNSSAIETLFTALVCLCALILIFRAGMKTPKRHLRILAFIVGIILTGVFVWNTATALRF